MFRVADLLPQALRSLVGPERARLAVLLEAWPEVVGEPLASHTRADGVRGGTFVVVTPLPAAAYELRLRRDALLDALNRRAGGAVIDDIQVLVRPGEANGAGPARMPEGRR